jgi:hypothetical protein
MPKRKSDDLPPLRRFDFKLVAQRLKGTYLNIDRDLRRRAEQAVRRGDFEGERRIVLLNMMHRFAWNSYETVLYIAGDTPEDPRRKPNFVLVVPNINRQLLDLLFSLAFMLDDFDVRSLEYQRSGWREFYEEVEQFRTHFGSDPCWKDYFRTSKETLRQMADRYQIKSEEQKNPAVIPYWKTPTRLRDEKTACRNFLRYLETWLYRDTSAQAHMSFGGLFKVSAFLVAEILGKDAVEKVNDRPMKMYHFEQISRTALSFLAISTEIDTYCKLNNHEAIDYIWGIFSDYAPEAKELWELRYQNRLR